MGFRSPRATGPAPPEPRDVTVGSFASKLAGCTLMYDGLGKQGSVTFEFPEPCQFSRDRNSAVRIVETGATRTLLVEASRPAGPGAGVRPATVSRTFAASSYR